MDFNMHFDLEGRHAFLSPSKHSWVNYSDDKLVQSYRNHLAVKRGTELHDLASRLIKLQVTLADNNKTLNRFVNDAIYYGMESEQVLRASDYCFGTADAISCDGRILRIHDLKTGVTKASMAQLMVYAAIFFIEYQFDYDPRTLPVELRIYQNDEITVYVPEPHELIAIMDKILYFSIVLAEEANN